MHPLIIAALISGGLQVGKGAWNYFNKDDDMATRPAVNNAAWKQNATAIQQLINQNLTQNTIPMINREWSNRYGSGQRQEAISRASESANQQGSNAIAQLALQQWMSQTGMEEERAWREAQLGSQPGWTDQLASGIGQVLPYLLYAKYGQGGQANPSAPPALPYSDEMWWLKPQQSYMPNFGR